MSWHDCIRLYASRISLTFTRPENRERHLIVIVAYVSMYAITGNFFNVQIICGFLLTINMCYSFQMLFPVILNISSMLCLFVHVIIYFQLKFRFLQQKKRI